VVESVAIAGSLAAIIATIVMLVPYFHKLLAYFRSRTSENNSNTAREEGKESICILSRIKTKCARIGFFHYPPLISAVQSDGKTIATGLYAEIWNKLASEHDIQTQWFQLNISDITNAVVDKEVDFVLCVFQTAQRSRYVDFTAFLHSVTVGGIAKQSLRNIHSQSDLINSDTKIAVCSGEIGHEIATSILKIPKRRLKITDTAHIAEIAVFVQHGDADVALADSLSCKNYLESTSASRPVMKQIFRQNPLDICPNGIMIARGQPRLADWLDSEMRRIRDEPDIQQLEERTLESVRSIIRRF